MVFLVQPIIAYVNGRQEINTPVTKTMRDICSSPDETLCSCVTGEFTAWTTRRFSNINKKNRKSNDTVASNTEIQLSRLEHDLKVHLGHIKKFSLEELNFATGNFHAKNMIGQGGFGRVYKGKLLDGSVVAVKRLGKSSRQGLFEFKRELMASSMAIHRNLLPVYGYSISCEEMLLVYPFMAKGNLQAQLQKGTLDWNKRKKIALGVSKGLVHLHEHCHSRIIHRDVKPSNILLKGNFEPVIGDFGLARPVGYVPFLDCSEESKTVEWSAYSYVDEATTHIYTQLMGTVGYLAPEYAISGRCSEKNDVYAFGVIILQLVSGHARPICMGTDDNRDNLSTWVRNLVGDMDINKIVDSKLQGEYVKEEMNQMIKIGLLCTGDCPKKRPQISEVIRMLEGVVTAPEWDNISQELYCSDIGTCCSWSGEAATGNDELESISKSTNEVD